jgi:hypothetical protein
MERTHTPLSVWFWAAYLVSSQTPGISAVQFQRQLGLSRYETAYQIFVRSCGVVHCGRHRILRPLAAAHRLQLFANTLSNNKRLHDQDSNMDTYGVRAIHPPPERGGFPRILLIASFAAKL